MKKRVLNSNLVKGYLKRNGLKHYALQVELECSESLISKMLTGHVPSDEKLKKLCKVMKCKMSELVKGGPK